ncbi:baculoviral IAP repeat-containing protein 3 [Biomphalaria pfeifferi]|uniref:Baculoviral IAP repeat-containing protein 3 n=1 Tax=Biomphalaria pfeifferi TaxID=112525 RepID=A0AAD8F7R1_BIOPF|nr:baculoviral IAP repeat-containing protein 3 [Biomphalaria pfeifferi]
MEFTGPYFRFMGAGNGAIYQNVNMTNTRKRSHDQMDPQEEISMPSGNKTIRMDGNGMFIQNGAKTVRMDANGMTIQNGNKVTRMNGNGMLIQNGSSVIRMDGHGIRTERLDRTCHKAKRTGAQGSCNKVQIQEVENDNDTSDEEVKNEKDADIINAVTALGFDENEAKDLLKSGCYKSAEQLADALLEKEECLKQEHQQRQGGLNDGSHEVESSGGTTSYAETSGNGYAAVKNFCSSPGGGSVSSTVTEGAGTSAEYQKLVEEIQALKEERQCKVCMEREACITFVPCGHFVACEKCCSGLKFCPICLSTFETTIKTFIPKE